LSDVSFIANLYGKTAASTPSSSGTRLTPFIAAAIGTFSDAGDTDLAIAAADWDVAGTSASAGVLTFTAGATNWGGKCKDDASVTELLFCNDGTSSSDEGEGDSPVAGDIQLFKTHEFTDYSSPMASGWRSVFATDGKFYIVHS